MDNLTPLDARNSLLLERSKTSASMSSATTFSMSNAVEKAPLARSESPERYLGNGPVYKPSPLQTNFNSPYRPLTPNTPIARSSRDNLVLGAAPISGRGDHNRQASLQSYRSGGGYSQSALSPGGYGGGGYPQTQVQGGYRPYNDYNNGNNYNNSYPPQSRGGY